MERVEDLAHEPEIGKTYLVRTKVWGPDNWWWPVLGKAHIDSWLPDFVHYHFDMRFFTEEMVATWEAMTRPPYRWIPTSWVLEMRRIGLHHNGEPLEYKPMKCERAMEPWNEPTIRALRESFGTDCVKAIWRDGRPYCPHQKQPLSAFWDGREATIACPVHGLRVRMDGGTRQ